MLLEASADDVRSARPEILVTNHFKIREVIISSIGSQSRFVKQSESDAIAALLGFVGRVTTVLETVVDDAQRYSAIICIDQISGRFGRKDPSKILLAARMLVGEQGIGSNTGRIQITALLTLASMLDILREDMLEHVPSIMQRCFQLLAVNSEAQIPKTSLHNAAFAVFNSITENLPFILSGDLLDNAFRAAQLATEMKFDEGDDFRDQFYRTVARQISASEVFSLVQRNYAWGRTQSYPALQDYYNLVKRVVERHPKKEVLKNSNSIFQFIGQAFELRACSDASDANLRVTSEEVEELEVLAIDIALAVVLKINDVTLRPFFIQLVEWTSWKSKDAQSGRISKAITLFQYLKALLAQLKVRSNLSCFPPLMASRLLSRATWHMCSIL
jgi:U3 small nucleolar RNA-associated protein 10